MALNKDGLEPGQVVDFDTINKLNARKRREAQNGRASESTEAPAKRKTGAKAGRPRKQAPVDNLADSETEGQAPGRGE